jgi:hypothetical protein
MPFKGDIGENVTVLVSVCASVVPDKSCQTNQNKATEEAFQSFYYNVWMWSFNLDLFRTGRILIAF